MSDIWRLADMEVFAHVVKAGSMSAAGRELNLAPAVVSKRMKRLEERLGARLLQRTTRQTVLTETGKEFYDRAVAILSSVEEAEGLVSSSSSLANGVLKISAPTSFGRLHIAPHLKLFLDRNPELIVDIRLSDEMVDIVGGGFDLAIRIAELSDSSLVAKRLAPCHRVLVAAPSYIEKAGGAPKSIDDLQSHTLLWHSVDPWHLDGPGGKIAVQTRGPLRTNSSEVLREAILNGLGIGLRSTWDVGPDLREGKLLHILPDWHASRRVAIYAVYPSRRFLPPKVRVFIDFLSSLYGPEPYWDAGLMLDGSAIAA